MRTGIILMVAVLAGCAALEPPRPPPPKMVWVKPGGTQAELLRVQGICNQRAARAGAPLQMLMTLTGCMQEAGWQEVPEQR